jgi:hypothetical protein
MNIDNLIYCSSIADKFMPDLSAKHDVALVIRHIDNIQYDFFSESVETQQWLVEHIICNMLPYKTRDERNQVREFAKQCGISVKTDTIAPQQQNITHAHGNVVLSDQQRTELLNSMLTIDFSYSEQYSDKLSKADHANIRQRGAVLAKLKTLSVDTLQLLANECSNDNNTKLILTYLESNKND